MPSGHPTAAVTISACNHVLDLGRDPIAVYYMSLLACRWRRPASWLCSASSTLQRSRMPASSPVSPASRLWTPRQQLQPAPLCGSWRPHWWMTRAGSLTGWQGPASGNALYHQVPALHRPACASDFALYLLCSARPAPGSLAATAAHAVQEDRNNLTAASWLHLRCSVLHARLSSLILDAGIAPCLPCATGAGQPRCKP